MVKCWNTRNLRQDTHNNRVLEALKLLSRLGQAFANINYLSFIHSNNTKTLSSSTDYKSACSPFVFISWRD